MDWSDFDYKDSSQHKGNSTVSIKGQCLYKASFGYSHGNECLKSWTGWFLRTIGPIHPIFGLLILLS